MRIISLTISEEGVHTLIIHEKFQKAILEASALLSDLVILIV
ncbi:MAG: hypothetical protein ACOYN5_15550 [Bacteroidales bacterium]